LQVYLPILFIQGNRHKITEQNWHLLHSWWSYR